MFEITKMDIAVIGAGPAGISSFISAVRAGYSVFLFERNEPGGLVRNANLVENYPGFSGGITGAELAGHFIKQINNPEIYLKKAEVIKVGLADDRGFILKTDCGDFFSCSLIIATGTKPVKINLEGYDKIKNRIYYDIISIPENDIRGKKFIIIGGGDAAFDYSLSIERLGGVPVIVSRSSTKCLPLLLWRVREKGIEIFTDTLANGIIPGKDGIILRCYKDRENFEIDSDYLLFACGRIPDMPLFEEPLKSILKYEQGSVKTSVPGLFLAGDVIRGDTRYVGIAVGDGINAAMWADRYLKSERNIDGSNC